MKFHELAEKRYSSRKLTGKVERALLDQIIETARLAPTAVNKQPFKIFLMESEEAKAKIQKVTPFTFGADTFLVVGYQEEQGWVREFDGRNFAQVDAAIVATHIMMEICELGLSTTWVGHFDAPLLKQSCPEMADYELIAIFPVGYAREEDKPSPLHFERRSRAAIVETL